MDIELIGQEMKKVELELSKIEEERDRLIEKLEDMRNKVTVFSCLKPRHQIVTKDLVIVPSYQSINNGLVLHNIHEITSIKELVLCVCLTRDSSFWELSRKVLVLKFGEDNVCEAESRIERYLDYLEKQKDK
ncbi:MAG: hypothetical protein ACTTKY_00325 [Catonella sp.]